MPLLVSVPLLVSDAVPRCPATAAQPLLVSVPALVRSAGEDGLLAVPLLVSVPVSWSALPLHRPLCQRAAVLVQRTGGIDVQRPCIHQTGWQYLRRRGH